MPLPYLPNEVLQTIIRKVGEDAFWMLGPFIRAGKRSKNLVFHAAVLHTVNISDLCDDPGSFYTASVNWLEGRGRKFFEKCLAKGNVLAIYNEGIRVAVAFNDLRGAVSLLSRNVLACGLATFGSAILSICLGDLVSAVAFLRLFFIHHAEEGDLRLTVIGDEFKRTIYNHGPGFMSTTIDSFQYPDCDFVRIPSCAFHHDFLVAEIKSVWGRTRNNKP